MLFTEKKKSHRKRSDLSYRLDLHLTALAELSHGQHDPGGPVLAEKGGVDGVRGVPELRRGEIHPAHDHVLSGAARSLQHALQFVEGHLHLRLEPARGGQARGGVGGGLAGDIQGAVVETEQLTGFEKKTNKIEDKMEEIRLVNKAKWLLISNEGLLEPEAHRYLEKEAMDRCTTRKQIAQEVIEKYSN